MLITLAGIGWIPARSARTLMLVGFTWVVLTIAYELAGRRALVHFQKQQGLIVFLRTVASGCVHDRIPDLR
jgi:hypothetical protein